MQTHMSPALVGRGSSAPLTLLLQSEPPPGPLCAFHKRKARRFLDIAINKTGQNVTQKPKNMQKISFPQPLRQNKSHLCKHFCLKKGNYCQVSKSGLFIQTSGCEQFYCHIPVPQCTGISTRHTVTRRDLGTELLF